MITSVGQRISSKWREEERLGGSTIAKSMKNKLQSKHKDLPDSTLRATHARIRRQGGGVRQYWGQVCFRSKWERRAHRRGTRLCEASPVRSVQLRRCSRHHDGPLIPGTASQSNAALLTCDCLFSLKKCQSVRTQVCCSSSCFCCFLPPLHPPFSPPSITARSKRCRWKNLNISGVERGLRFTPPV